MIFEKIEKNNFIKNYHLREFKKKDLKQLVDLFKRVFKKDWDWNFWNWFLYENPRPTVGYSLWDQEKLIGVNFGITKLVSIHGKIHDSALLSTALVHYDYRRQGIYTYIGKKLYNLLANKGYLFCYGFPNEFYECKPYGKNKLEWDHCNKKQILIKPIKRMNYNSKSKKASKLRIEKINQFPQEINTITRLRKEGIYFIKYHNDLNWRYIDHPKNDYSCFIIHDINDYLKGYFVLKTYISKTNERFGEIDDFLILSDDQASFNEIYDFIFNFFKEREHNYISTWVGENNKFFNFLINKGFEKQQMKTSWGFKILNKQCDEYLRSKIMNVYNWDLKMGDSDIF
ncbi:MAG: GNAT family N-acetyltransferase [Candidatus Helarchaeota archaeon]